ncbi:hypothetical protein Pla22_06050 [Rubripirellula amarantea]|uniref:Uncharacterized protein n=1 Tax=Rubripirellula amarantea TaxID=2527999 RepID=A0A5C5WR04_9BACT|nr:hypothetical protein Pla22_06050 [Rubripirellula amarantea]
MGGWIEGRFGEFHAGPPRVNLVVRARDLLIARTLGLFPSQFAGGHGLRQRQHSAPYHGADTYLPTNTTTRAAIAAPPPTSPTPSPVLALMLMSSTEICRTSAIWDRMLSI